MRDELQISDSCSQCLPKPVMWYYEETAFNLGQFTACTGLECPECTGLQGSLVEKLFSDFKPPVNDSMMKDFATASLVSGASTGLDGKPNAVDTLAESVDTLAESVDTLAETVDTLSSSDTQDASSQWNEVSGSCNNHDQVVLAGLADEDYKEITSCASKATYRECHRVGQFCCTKEVCTDYFQIKPFRQCLVENLGIDDACSRCIPQPNTPGWRKKIAACADGEVLGFDPISV